MLLVRTIYIIAAAYNLALVATIVFKTRRDTPGRDFAWYLLAASSWMACTAAMHIGFAPDTILWLTRATFIFAACICMTWVWFCAGFPQPSVPFCRVALWLTAIGLLLSPLSLTPYMIPTASLEDWGVSATVGPAIAPYFLWALTCMVAGIVHLFLKGKRLRGMERLQVRYILLGAAGVTITGALVNLLLPMLTNETRSAPFGALSVLFVTTTTTYSIVRHRLMDIHIVLRAGLVYSLTIAALALLGALLIFPLSAYFAMDSAASSFIAAFILALAFQPIRQVAQTVVDRRFFKSVYDYRITLRDAGNALASAREREVLVATLANALLRTMKPRGVAVYLPDSDGQLAQTTLIGTAIALPAQLAMTNPVLASAVDADEVLVAEELQRQTVAQQTIGSMMRTDGIYIALPLLAGEQLCGIVFLGEKLSGDVYTTDDVALLRILGKQAAIALDNAQHYHEMVLLNEYHERLLHTMQDGVIALDPQGRITTFNPAAESITGICAEEALHQRLVTLELSQFPTVPTADPIEVTITSRQGASIPLLVTVTPFTRRSDSAASHLLVFRDLSAMRALEQQKMQAERFSSMGAMAASLAHEIKNPLVPIKTFAHLLPTKFDDVEFREDFSQTVVNEVERINRLVGQMLDLVRNPTEDRQAIDVAEMLDRLLVLIRPDCERSGIHLHVGVAEALPEIQGVPGQLYQAILNVLMNAVQVMPDGGDLYINVGIAEGMLNVRITDTGPGVTAEALPHIFEPLFTTKEGGHGLGLALTYQFIRSHGGEIHAECPPGYGLSVTLSVPVVSPVTNELVCA